MNAAEILSHPLVQAAHTPCYVYNMALLRRTLDAIAVAAGDFHVHYAVKANSNPRILREISACGFGADTVSRGEISEALECGFRPEDIFFAGVGKRDDEIEMALEAGIGCFNVESVEELEVISQIAAARGRTATVALRVNPHIDAHTHKYITTGMSENKFGIDITVLDSAVDRALALPAIELAGLHLHIGSQVTEFTPYALSAQLASKLYRQYLAKGIRFRSLNLGGGLGIDYKNPDSNPVADFSGFFDTIRRSLDLPYPCEIHVEPGRAVVGQCGNLLSTVLYIKQGLGRKFAIIDAGFTELIRPAFYGAFHRIDTDSRSNTVAEYDVVGPVCESSDIFAREAELPEIVRGNRLLIRSAGAYGESMSSAYNSRHACPTVYIDDAGEDK